MKKILFLLIVFALCFAMSIPAYADFTEDGLTVTIPDSINLSGTTHSKAIGISGSLPVNKIADITVSSENAFSMKNDLNTESVLRYFVSVAGKDIKSGDSVLTASSAEASNRKTATLNFKIIDTPKTAGTYKDTLTFTLSLKDNPLTRIEITTPPTKTEYTAGETFDPSGMIVTAYYADESSQPVSDYTVLDGNALVAGKSSVTVSYAENSISKTAVVSITVNSAVPLLKSGSGWYRGSLARADITSVTFNVTKTDSMFSNCQTLEIIYVDDSFSTENVTGSEKMFLYNYALKGAISYEVGKDDATYANYTTGYLTYKAA